MAVTSDLHSLVLGFKWQSFAFSLVVAAAICTEVGIPVLQQDKSICHLQHHQVALENKQKADLRHQEALRKLAVDKAYKEYEDTKNIRNRYDCNIYFIDFDIIY